LVQKISTKGLRGRKTLPLSILFQKRYRKKKWSKGDQTKEKKRGRSEIKLSEEKTHPHAGKKKKRTIWHDDLTPASLEATKPNPNTKR